MGILSTYRVGLAGVIGILVAGSLLAGNQPVTAASGEPAAPPPVISLMPFLMLPTEPTEGESDQARSRLPSPSGEGLTLRTFDLALPLPDDPEGDPESQGAGEPPPR